MDSTVSSWADVQQITVTVGVREPCLSNSHQVEVVCNEMIVDDVGSLGEGSRIDERKRHKFLSSSGPCVPAALPALAPRFVERLT